MLYFERIEAKLNLAMEYINKLDKYAQEKGKENLHKSIQKLLEKIKEI